MRKRSFMSVSTALAIVMAGIVGSTPGRAGGVTGQATEWTQLLNNGELVALVGKSSEQINNQMTQIAQLAEQIQNQIRMYENMLQNTAQLPFHVWSQVENDLNRLRSLVALVGQQLLPTLHRLRQMGIHRVAGHLRLGLLDPFEDLLVFGIRPFAMGLVREEKFSPQLGHLVEGIDQPDENEVPCGCDDKLMELPVRMLNRLGFAEQGARVLQVLLELGDIFIRAPRACEFDCLNFQNAACLQ